jgi:phospholipid-translocating ATPase
LDGESNLKVRSASSETKQLLTDAAIGGFTGVVKCGPPDEKIYTFDSQLRPGPGTCSVFLVCGDPCWHDVTPCPDSRRVTSLSAEQLLLQATHLRNTDFVYGIAVYTGNETKFGNNKKTPPPKLTKTDRMIDRFSLYIFIFQVRSVFALTRRVVAMRIL